MKNYSAIKKSEIMPFAATGVDLRDYHTNWSKSDRERQILYDIIYMESKKATNELTYRTKIELQM